jgi:hypothetical protein
MITRCKVCGRPLKNPESIRLGFGPTCKKRLPTIAPVDLALDDYEGAPGTRIYRAGHNVPGYEVLRAGSAILLKAKIDHLRDCTRADLMICPITVDLPDLSESVSLIERDLEDIVTMGEGIITVIRITTLPRLDPDDPPMVLVMGPRMAQDIVSIMDPVYIDRVEVRDPRLAGEWTEASVPFIDAICRVIDAAKNTLIKKGE